MTSVSQILVLEEALGIAIGHGETRALVARLLGDYGEGERRSAATGIAWR